MGSVSLRLGADEEGREPAPGPERAARLQARALQAIAASDASAARTSAHAAQLCEVAAEVCDAIGEDAALRLVSTGR